MCVAPEDVRVCRRPALDERETLVQDGDALLRFGMVGRRVQADEVAVAYELDVLICSKISSSGLSPRERPIR